MVEPTFIPAASFVFKRAPADIRLKCVAFAIASFWIRRETSMVMELLADFGVVEPAIFFFGAVSSGVVSANFLLFLVSARSLSRFSFWPVIRRGRRRGITGARGSVIILRTHVRWVHGGAIDCVVFVLGDALERFIHI